MNDPEENIKVRPESLHKPLLRATFLSGAAAVDAWEEWRAEIDLDGYLDSGSFSLLPHLFHNLRKLDVDDPIMMKLKGVARKSWVNNQRTLYSKRVPWQRFSERGIDVLLLPGAATALQYYSDFVLKPPTEINLLIRPDTVQTVVRMLQALGWTAETEFPPGEIEAAISFRSPLRLQSGDGLSLQLLWRTTPRGCADEIDGALWSAAKSAQMQNSSVFVLNPTDHMLWVSSHGLLHAPHPFFDRAAETMLILKAASDVVDWPRLVAQAQIRWQRIPLLEVLQYLLETLDIPIPTSAFANLKNSPLIQSEQRAYDFRQYEPTKGWRKGVVLWFDHVQCSGDDRWLARIIKFPWYLKAAWKLESIWLIPVYAIWAFLHNR